MGHEDQSLGARFGRSCQHRWGYHLLVGWTLSDNLLPRQNDPNVGYQEGRMLTDFNASQERNSRPGKQPKWDYVCLSRFWQNPHLEAARGWPFAVLLNQQRHHDHKLNGIKRRQCPCGWNRHWASQPIRLAKWTLFLDHRVSRATRVTFEWSRHLPS